MCDSKPSKFPVRQVGDQWEVLALPNDVWLRTANEADARAIAAAPVLEYEALEATRCGADFAAELDRTSDALARYQMGYGSRFFARAAERMPDPPIVSGAVELGG